ncbi:hypothetical protein [Nannocystis pusilla]|uniref:hypothetical protein n=1 Tax=Nannocystis pusilla TaxID=889268 RepID=UPI003B766FFC
MCAAPGSRPEPSGAELHAAAYRCWYESWSEAFRELGKPGPLHSDAFTRQKEMCALFIGEQCMALSFMTPVDLEYPLARADSYFHNWSDRALTSLARDGSLVMINGNFTVHADARRAAPGFSLRRPPGPVPRALPRVARHRDDGRRSQDPQRARARPPLGRPDPRGGQALRTRRPGRPRRVLQARGEAPPPLEFDATVRELWDARTVVRPQTSSP